MSGVDVQITPRLLGERYRLVERLGAGGMSVVWRGFDEVLGRQVAVKVLTPELADDRTLRYRTRLEAKAAARLCHPHITGVYDYGESAEGGVTLPYVVMELVEGETLASRMTRCGALPWQEAVQICAEVAAALATAHARGIVHRDVAPGNVMLTATGAKVLDFGISALVGEQEPGPGGELYGTPAYLAPERLERGQVTAATDVYTLGLLLYRCLAGRPPWAVTTKTEMLQAHIYHEPAPLPPVPGLPGEIARLCEQCLAKTPADRPDSAYLARELADAVGSAAILPVSPAPGGAPAALDDDVLANAGTALLPSSVDATPMPRPRTLEQPAPVDRSRRRRLTSVAVGAGLLAVPATVWAVTAGGAGTPQPARAADEPAPCQVDYALRADDGHTFDAAVTVRNVSGAAVPDWRLSFAFPGEQRVTDGGSGRWQQQGQSVAAAPASATGVPLAAGASASLRLTGAYTGGNPLPTEFRLNDAACTVRVSGLVNTPGAAPAAEDAARLAAPPGAAARPAVVGTVKQQADRPAAPGAGKGPKAGPAGSGPHASGRGSHASEGGSHASGGGSSGKGQPGHGTGAKPPHKPRKPGKPGKGQPGNGHKKKPGKPGTHRLSADDHVGDRSSDTAAGHGRH
jgi:serine/threonine-protein kinase